MIIELCGVKFVCIGNHIKLTVKKKSISSLGDHPPPLGTLSIDDDEVSGCRPEVVEAT